jgi:hypothetical protein
MEGQSVVLRRMEAKGRQRACRVAYRKEVDNRATEPVDTSDRGTNDGSGGMSKRGSQEADDDGRPAEWHAGTKKKTDNWNRQEAT